MGNQSFIKLTTMKKIMFSDKYGLTKAVLEGRKTQTRRILTVDMVNRTDLKCLLEGDYKCCLNKDDDYVDIRRMGNYQVREVVAIAQRYSDIEDFLPFDRNFDIERGGKERAGWNNKMFVEAMYMPHHIRITDVRVERLQDISDEDCIAEGITHVYGKYDLEVLPRDFDSYSFKGPDYSFVYKTAREAYSALIDKISGKGTWDANPYVFVYEFELVD